MPQRVLEPGQIEILAQRSIPRIRLPDSRAIFLRRGARLHEIAPASSIGDYLEMLAVIAGAQHDAIGQIAASPPDAAQLQRSREHGMPPMNAASWPRAAAWQSTLEKLCATLESDQRFPRAVAAAVVQIQSASSAWREMQADALLQAQPIDAENVAAAPVIMAALQVHWVAAASRLHPDQVLPLDVHGVCPFCGSLPVASMVCARGQYQGYRYLHCGLCAIEWHMVRVQCTCCGANGKDISYHTLERVESIDDVQGRRMPAVRAETCEHCRGYRKILYEEQDPAIEPVADDLGTLALDVLLSEQGYLRASGNPMLWMPASPDQHA